MTKEEMLRLMRLLSALESALMFESMSKRAIPDYLLEDISTCVQVLEREILK